MKKRIYFILFLSLIFSFGKEISAQDCEGTIQASAIGFDWPNGFEIGDGTAGDIEVCITPNTITAAGMGCNNADIYVTSLEGGGTGWIIPPGWTGCQTFANGTGTAWLAMDQIACMLGDATITWQTVDGSSTNVCTVPTCIDGIMNGDETGIDCGGATCPACGAASCVDLVQNQDETGIDCGGVCPACPTAPDACLDAEVVPVDGSCQTNTTEGAGDSWSSTVGCQSADGHADVWFEFTATASNVDFTITSGTIGGDLELIVVIPNCASSNCNCTFGLIGSECGASVLTVSYNVTIGQNYYYTISSTGAEGTFDHCVETNDNVAPGQDCNTAQALCVDGGFSVGNLQNGNGAVAESGWLSCAAEQNTQWYTFSAATSGSFAAMIEPDTWTSPATGDDYDFALLDITVAGCTAGTTTELACDYSPCQGSTGFSATAGAGFGQTAVTDYRADDPAGQADCTPGQVKGQWNTNAVNLVAGNTYAYMIQNYSGSTGGAVITFGGTSSLVMDATFNGTIQGDCYTYPLTLNSVYKGANWTYLWDMGDAGAGSYTVGSSASAEPTYLYATDGTYNVSFTMTNGAACIANGSASVTTGCPLPVELTSFTGNCQNNEVKLSWSTASEIGNEQFTIQKSIDGETYQNIGIVTGSGTTTNVSKYNFIDNNPQRAGSYYRLKQSNFNGESSYSKIVRVNHCGSYGMTVLPNPSKGEFNIVFDSNAKGNHDVVVFDITGKIIYEGNFDVGADNNYDYKLDLSPFEKGVYIMRVSNKSENFNVKIITE